MYRKKFGKQYLESEGRMHRYLQLTSSQVDHYVAHHGLLRECACCYFDKAKDETMYEFHVDACDAFLEHLCMKIELGGNLSFKFGKSRLSIEEHSRYKENGDVPANIGFRVEEIIYVDGNLCSETFRDIE